MKAIKIMIITAIISAALFDLGVLEWEFVFEFLFDDCEAVSAGPCMHNE